jgi:hypothetical protein
MKFRGGEFSTGTMRNFQPELTRGVIGPRGSLPLARNPSRIDARRGDHLLQADLRTNDRLCRVFEVSIRMLVP